MASGRMLASAVATMLRDGLIYVVTPSGDVEEAKLSGGLVSTTAAEEMRILSLRGDLYLMRAMADAQAAKIRRRN
jgi:hypothetical protein